MLDENGIEYNCKGSFRRRGFPKISIPGESEVYIGLSGIRELIENYVKE